MTKSHPGRGGDGLEDLGKRKGRRWWRARLYWRDERTGAEREKRKTFQADTRPIAVAKREALLAEAMAGMLDQRRRKFAEVAAESIAGVTRHGTRKTMESLNRSLCRHFGDWYIDKIAARHISDYLESLDLSTPANHRAALSRVFRHAMRCRYITTNPMRDVVLPRRQVTLEDMQPKPPKAMTTEQVQRYFAYLEEHEPDLYPLVHTQFMLGCRFAEVSALRRCDVDLESGLVTIARGQLMGVVGPPKGNAARVAALPLETRAMLRAHLDRMAVERWPGWEELVFPRPATPRARTSNFWSSSTIHQKIKSAYFALGMRMGSVTHSARHTMISVAAQVAPSEALTRAVTGHKSVAVHTAYQHVEPARVVQLAERVGQSMTRSKIGRKTGASGGATSEDASKQGIE